MTCYILMRDHYDCTIRIAAYTKDALEREKQSWLDAAIAQNQVNIAEYEKQIQDKEEKKQEFMDSDYQLLAEAKSAKESGDIQRSKALNKERKRLQKYIDAVTFEINSFERKICDLKILTDSDIIKSYMRKMNYYIEEIELFE